MVWLLWNFLELKEFEIYQLCDWNLFCSWYFGSDRLKFLIEIEMKEFEIYQ